MLTNVQSKPNKNIILGRNMKPPYLDTTVRGDIYALTRRWRKTRKQDGTVEISPKGKGLTINDAIRYIKYLENRYPKLGSLSHIAVPQLFEEESIGKYFKPALQSYGDFVRQQREETAKKREVYLNQKKHCQVCSFTFTPLLQIHHVVPMTQGGDNRLVTVLCPNCHRLVHFLVSLESRYKRSRRKRQALREFRWWARRENVSDWSSEVDERINTLVKLYFAHLDYVNYDTFLREHVRVKMDELPFLIYSPYEQPRIL